MADAGQRPAAGCCAAIASGVWRPIDHRRDHGDVFENSGALVEFQLRTQIVGAEVQWRCLQGGRYAQMSPDQDGVFRSKVLPGLWIEEGAVHQGNLTRLLEVLEQGMASPEFKAFTSGPPYNSLWFP